MTRLKGGPVVTCRNYGFVSGAPAGAVRSGPQPPRSGQHHGPARRRDRSSLKVTTRPLDCPAAERGGGGLSSLLRSCVRGIRIFPSPSRRVGLEG